MTFVTSPSLVSTILLMRLSRNMSLKHMQKALGLVAISFASPESVTLPALRIHLKALPRLFLRPKTHAAELR